VAPHYCRAQDCMNAVSLIYFYFLFSCVAAALLGDLDLGRSTHTMSWNLKKWMSDP